MIALLLLATASGGPTMPELSAQFMRNNMSGNEISVNFLLDDEGKVVTCEVLTPGVSEKRKEAVCAKTLDEMAGEPATGPDGEPVYGYVVGSVIRQGAARRPIDKGLRKEPDVTLFVDSLPNGETVLDYSFLGYFDKAGLLRKCRAYTDENKEFLKPSCQYALEAQFDILNGRDGQPVPYVDGVLVRFEVQAPTG